VRPLFVLMALAVTTRLLQAQSSLSPDQLADWQRNRTTVLAYIDAMPDSATGFRPTPGVRSFAEQFDHIVTTNLEVAALRKYAAATYDYLLKALQEAKPAQLSKPVAIYGQPPQPASRLAMLSYEHAVWTLGQVVPYLRLNGVKPPEYRMPF
jgi:hypothetical protein